MIYTLVTDERPIAVCTALDEEDAWAAFTTTFFLGEIALLRLLETGLPLWDGASELDVRPATYNERLAWVSSRDAAFRAGRLTSNDPESVDWMAILGIVERTNDEHGVWLDDLEPPLSSSERETFPFDPTGEWSGAHGRAN